MTVDERRLPSVLTDLYLGPTPDYRDDLLARAARTRQRPAWSFPGRWLPMAEITSRTAVAPRLPWRTIALALVIVALLIAGTLAFIGSRQPKLPPPFGVARNGLIAFERHGDIVTLDPATARTVALVATPEYDSAPLFSSDGTKVAFKRELPDGDPALYVVKTDGTGPVRVTPEPLTDLLDWTFSPDGRRLLVTAAVNGQARMFEVGSDGLGRPQPLDVQLPTDLGAVEAPRYRPTNGSQALVIEWLPGAPGRSLALVDLATGTKRTLVEPSSAYDVYGAGWSPNGEWISYGKFDPNADDRSSRTHIMAADGTADRVADSEGGTVYDGMNGWSNDSKRIVLIRGYAGDQSNEHTAVVAIDGTTAAVELTCPMSGVTNCGEGWTWSPDDGTLLGGVGLEEQSARYLLADPVTGRVTEEPWTARGVGSWQRISD